MRIEIGEPIWVALINGVLSNNSKLRDRREGRGLISFRIYGCFGRERLHIITSEHNLIDN
jgi:hypothetical protein